ncbi:hypothetical protein FEDK69T_04680 [Flavobacterium enshiense DK69]|uniref:VTC domain-containing protein n=1 Tax=Flavobacterium enshiense DK69 TaxID=1107311 RepID=V6SEL6_9FLAO|nr:polyphosphate polymerase domain-containing protein [Flavobacterium enshiense]ESU24914.1 hypothetical protein FEDK69T_04680 [Flavobacterium enshiense DK69]KGO96642.1 hypothetical protein Q767_02720 [Flavobacterium enshiense DK69]
MFKKFTNQLSLLNPVSLAELEAVSLLNRTDSKYTLRSEDLLKIVPCLVEHYNVLEINGTRIFSYENNYFDTPDLQFFKDHHNGYVNRIKVRSRRYVESDMCFFEIKKKEKVDRTNKHREPIPYMISDIDEIRKNLIQEYSRKAIEEVTLILKNNFNRITLVNNQFTERVTIDMNLHFIDDEHDIKFKKIAIIEIKQSKSTHSSPLTTFLKYNNIREQSISKYIYGVITLIPSVKKNNFMPILKKINKLQR